MRWGLAGLAATLHVLQCPQATVAFLPPGVAHTLGGSIRSAVSSFSSLHAIYNPNDFGGQVRLLIVVHAG
jgi:hypothetical protein